MKQLIKSELKALGQIARFFAPVVGVAVYLWIVLTVAGVAFGGGF